jgi:ATP adenylyltransferase
MDRLWTPWRRAFVESAGSSGDVGSGCFLCDYPRRSPERDAESLLLFRGVHAFVVMNLYPYNSGHLLVAPYEHTGNLEELSSEVATEMMAITQRTIATLKAVYRPDAFNVGMNLGKSAGAGIPDHLHTHLVPRWDGDTNFMPILGETKVLPETLEQTYRRLRPQFD